MKKFLSTISAAVFLCFISLSPATAADAAAEGNMHGSGGMMQEDKGMKSGGSTEQSGIQSDGGMGRSGMQPGGGMGQKNDMKKNDEGIKQGGGSGSM
ncbi:MAG: hypothetical protein LBQ51_07010 [Desulfovibrio sp.]|jgi:hypothetical protein|nr:hypothetical protein [Desulfovibrio sp.]